MKTFILLLVIAAQPLFAQTVLDRIQKTDQSFIEGKVTRITDEYIEYKHANNLDGPLYTITKNQVSKITYSNGFEETINSPSPAQTTPSAVPPSVSSNASTQPATQYAPQPTYANPQAFKYANTSPREPLLASVLSFVIPGAGQVYNKQYGKGVAMFGTSVVSWILAANSAVNSVNYDALYSGYYDEPNYAGFYIFTGLAVATSLYSIIDAGVSAKKINQRYSLISRLKVEPQTHFALQGNQMRPTWGAKLTYSLH